MASSLGASAVFGFSSGFCLLGSVTGLGAGLCLGFSSAAGSDFGSSLGASSFLGSAALGSSLASSLGTSAVFGFSSGLFSGFLAFFVAFVFLAWGLLALLDCLSSLTSLVLTADSTFTKPVTYAERASQTPNAMNVIA